MVKFILKKCKNLTQIVEASENINNKNYKIQG